MNKAEAIEAMKAGAKITHVNFLPEEWIIMEGNKTIVTEECYAVSAAEFWRWRTGGNWDNGYSIWTQNN